MFKKILALVAIFCCSIGLASDHIDGVPSVADGQADLTDFYVFPTDDGQKLNLILNAYPAADREAHFSYKVGYNIVIRSADIVDMDNFSSVEASDFDEIRITCVFQEKNHHSHHRQDLHCDFLDEDSHSILSMDSQAGLIATNTGMVKPGSVKLFAGPRSDPFFISRELFSVVTSRKNSKANELFNSENKNVMEDLNVLTIALELDINDLLSRPFGMYAFAAESFNVETGEVIDRVGRPEVTNLSLHNHNSLLGPLKVSYNSISAFDSEADISLYVDRLIENISDYDKINEISWDKDEVASLAYVLANDYLVLDLGKYCSLEYDDFLEIEMSLLSGREHETCGGRRITDNIMNTLYSLYIDNYRGEERTFTNGLLGPTLTLSEEFPYLVEPTATPFIKKMLFKFAKGQQEKP